MDMGPSADKGGSIKGLEFKKFTSIHHPRDNFPDIIGDIQPGWNDSIDLFGIIKGAPGLPPACIQLPGRGKVSDDLPNDLDAVGIILSQIIGHPRFPAVDKGASQFVGSNFLPRGRQHKGRAAKKNSAGPLHMDDFVAHGRDIGSPCRAQTHHAAYLWDAHLGDDGLVVKYPSSVIRVGEDLGLERQERASRVHKIDEGKAVFHGDILEPKAFLYPHGINGSPLYGGIIEMHHRLTAAHPPYPGDQPGAMHFFVVQAFCRKRGDFQERGVSIQQQFEPFRNTQLFLLGQSGQRLLGAFFTGNPQFVLKVGYPFSHDPVVFPVSLAFGIDSRFYDWHVRLSF